MPGGPAAGRRGRAGCRRGPRSPSGPPCERNHRRWDRRSWSSRPTPGARRGPAVPAALSSVTLLRRLGHDSRKNRLYRAFRELGRAVRTLVLLRYLSEPELRESITAMMNKVEAFHGFAAWLMFGGDILGHSDPDHHEKIVKFKRADRQLCDLPDRAGHHRRGQPARRRRPGGRPRRPGHHLPLHPGEHPPVRRMRPRHDHARTGSHHPARYRPG
ncbi:hypothetical protein FMEAI12_6470004 [Parafrankia sp. Ea1.12]|nr:hypothetical protein FMEAI12_6470004 [Parafrankia sp. Ea1.12]